MILNIYTVFDKKAEAYLQPFFAPTDGVAQRMFEEAVLEGDHIFGNHPEDFSLWVAGTFSQLDGKVVTLPLECLCRAHELVAVVENKMNDQVKGHEVMMVTKDGLKKEMVHA